MKQRGGGGAGFCEASLQRFEGWFFGGLFLSSVENVGCTLCDNAHVFYRGFAPNVAFVLIKADVQNSVYVVFNSSMLGHV